MFVLAVLFIALFISLAGFLSMLFGVVSPHAFMLTPDLAANLWFHSLDASSPWLVTAAYWTSQIFSPVTLSLAGLGFAAWFAHRKHRRHFFITISSIPIGAALTLLTKAVVAFPRPSDAIISAFGYSFPSGHAAASGLALVLLLYFFLPPAPSHKHRAVIISVVSLVVLAVGLSRLVLEVHWLSDIIAGYCLGGFSATLAIILGRLEYGRQHIRSSL